MIAFAYFAFAVLTAFLLRCISPLFQRVNDMHWQALVLIDIVAAFAIFWPLFILGLIAERPRAGQTISAICGGAAMQNQGWAKVAAALIDALFLALTSQRGHCADAWRRWSNPLAY